MSELSLVQSDPYSLMEAAAIGNPDAFNALHAQFFAPVYRFIAARVDSKQEADALAESVFTKIFAYLGEHKGQKESAHYFLHTAQQEVAEYTKTGVLPVKIEHEVIEVILPKSSPMLQQSELHNALRALSDDQQDVVVLKFINELPIADIAKLLEKSEVDVRAIQAKALKAVGKKLTTLL